MGSIQEDPTSEQLQRQTSREGLKDLRFDEAIKAAIEQGSPDIVKELLSQPRSTPKTPPEDQSPNSEACGDANSETALMLACRLGRLEIVEILLEWMAQCSSQDQLGELPGSWTDPVAVDSEGNTALHLAATEGHDQIVEILLQNNRELLEKTNEKEKTALQLACESGKSSVVQLLLDNNANSSMSDDDDNMPIHEASWLGHLDIVKALLHANMEHLETKNIGGNTAFLNAAQRGHPELLRYLISVGADQSVSNKINNTALHLASSADKENIDVVKILLEKASLEAENIDGRTPLLSACRNGNTGIVQLLLESGASSKIKDTLNKDTVLHLAACSGNLECFEGLYERLPDYLNEGNGYGASPLHLACQFGHASIVSFLLDKDADPRVKDDDNEDTPLHLAVSAKKVELVEILLKRDMDLLNLKNAKGETALHVAGSCSSIEVVNSLLENGADIYSVDSTGENILHKAVNGSQIDLVEFLLKRKIEIRPSHRGRTPLHFACYNGNHHLATIFLSHLAENPSKKQEILYYKDEWGDTSLGDAASTGNVCMVLQFLKDPVYFSQDSSKYLATDKIWFSDAEECERVNKLLKSKLKSLEPMSKNGSNISRQSPSPATDHEIREIDKSLTEICYWAILNGQLKLVKACVNRAGKRERNLILEKDKTTWLHIFAIGCDGDSQNPSEPIPLQLVPPESRSGLIPDNRGVTPLHLAVKYARVKMVLSFLYSARSQTPGSLKGILQQTLDDRKDTTISLANAGEHPKHRAIAKLLWRKITEEIHQDAVRRKGHFNVVLDEHTTLALELAAQFDSTREQSLLKSLLCQFTYDPRVGTDVLSLAIYCQLPKVVWWIISHGAYVHDRDIKNAHSIFNGFNFSVGSRNIERWQQIQKLLENPPPLSRFGTRDDDLPLPEIESRPDDYDSFPWGTIMDFLHSDGSTNITFKMKRRSLKDIIHIQGPQRIMDSSEDVSYDALFQSTKDDTAPMNASETPMTNRSHPGDQRRADTDTSKNREVTDASPPRGRDPEPRPKAKRIDQKGRHGVRWIHIPINDNLMVRSLKDKEITITEYRALLRFISESWSQLDAGKKKYMKPQCLKRSPSTRNSAKDFESEVNKESKNDNRIDKSNSNRDDKGSSQIALYIPFLSFMGVHQHITRNKGHRESVSDSPSYSLFRDPWKHNITHDYLTLDQYYYVYLSQTDKRDKTQVLSRFMKRMKRKNEEEQEQLWNKSRNIPIKILTVNQLWLWVLDDRTILTSTTDELDEDVDGFLQCVLHNFQEQARDLALSTKEIVEFIVATAIGLSQRKGITVAPQSYKKSPLDVFHESIIKVQNEEKILFDKFSETLVAGKNKAFNKSAEKGDPTKNDDYSYGNVSKETYYLGEVKDILDELNILKNLVEDQDRVWKQLSEADAPAHNLSMFGFDTPSDIRRAIEEMTKETETVQKSLHTLLSLKQNQAGIVEAKSAREQSATIMVFTVITIIFLPATFLTGIFALNVTEFPHEGDNVTYKASWIFPIIILVSLGTSAVFFLFAFSPNWLTKYSEKGAGNGEDRLVTSDLQSEQLVGHSEEQRKDSTSRYKGTSLFRRKVKDKVGSPPDCEH
ncbi:ankyrin [Penicillium brevicompactum]|uniref:Ankyrin n=1 Tax=Penicillium brevicompactum TaxID=5074 RepID=A0A9W9QMA7_PENBR|nr:ankyrin [Penicillium brevicompactum]